MLTNFREYVVSFMDVINFQYIRCNICAKLLQNLKLYWMHKFQKPKFVVNGTKWRMHSSVEME